MESAPSSDAMEVCKLTGKLFGVGVGPGDPELITLKAARIIQNSRIIAYPATETSESFARNIAQECIPFDAIEIPIKIPMIESRYLGQAIYNKAYDIINSYLEKGLDVTVLCQGDPFFYGSFMYLFSRFIGKVSIEVIPGITSLVACSSVALRPLCARNDTVSIIPGGIEDHEIETHLKKGGAFAIMKVGRHVQRLKGILGRLSLLERAVYISHATLPNQNVLPLVDAPNHAPYFSMILIPSLDEYVNY